MRSDRAFTGSPCFRAARVGKRVASVAVVHGNIAAPKGQIVRDGLK